MFPITINGKIKKPVHLAAADTLLSQIETCLLAEGMQVHEMDQRTVKFKAPFVLCWQPSTTLLFLIRDGELKLEQKGNDLHLEYKLRFHRVIYLFLVMILASLFVSGHRFDHLLTALTIGTVVLSPLIVMTLLTFKSFIGKCVESCNDRQSIG